MCECMREKKRERSTLMKQHKMGGKIRITQVTLTSLIYPKYKNTFHEVYIGFMCNGAHVHIEYRYKYVSPTLND